jgi:hypothetical protein
MKIKLFHNAFPGIDLRSQHSCHICERNEPDQKIRAEILMEYQGVVMVMDETKRMKKGRNLKICNAQ